MSQVTVGVLHPGEMGASVGAAARSGDADVVWASEGRSESTQARAAAAGLRDVGTLQHLARASDIILSVCPPGAAADVAHAVASYRFSKVYVDANAVSPETARKVGAVVEKGGATFVDGGIIGRRHGQRGARGCISRGRRPSRSQRSSRLGLSTSLCSRAASVPLPRLRWRSLRTPRALRHSS